MIATNQGLTERTLEEVQRLLRTRQRKAKASLSLSEELIEATDVVAGSSQRSAFVDRALRWYLRAMVRAARDARDRERIDAHAQAMNQDSDDLLDLQAWPE